MTKYGTKFFEKIKRLQFEVDLIQGTKIYKKKFSLETLN